MSDSTSRSRGPNHGAENGAGRFPLARSSRVLVEELDDETLVYDLDTHKAHCLNRAAALVWRRSDGATSIGALADMLPEAELPRDEDLVWLALKDLDKAGLLAQSDVPAARKKISRRDVVRALGATAGLTLALPAVTSLVAPLAAQAASCLTQNQCQNKGKKDCSGLPICGAPNFCCANAGKKGCDAVPC